MDSNQPTETWFYVAMICSKTLIFLTLVFWTSIGLYVGGGYSGLSGTLILLEEYGPIKERGNPALDDPPEMWTNPDTNVWEPRNPNKPGNRVPQAFNIVQIFLIVWAVFMFLNSILFIIDSIRSQKAIQDRMYRGSRVGESSLSCTAWIVGYCVFLAMFWFIQAGFAVLPLLEYRITMQRCWDLDNPHFSPVTDQHICVDLVQYGLVLYKETNIDDYGLVCGPGGYHPSRGGDLKGFCETYYPTFAAFIMCFAGAGIGVLTLILFAIHFTSNFSYLKIRRFESPQSTAYIPSPIKPPSSRPKSRRSEPRSHSSAAGPPVYPAYEHEASRTNGMNMYNPNYENNMSTTNSHKPVPEVMSFQRYHAEEEDAIEMHTMTSEKEREMTYYDGDSEDDRYTERERNREQSRRSDASPSPPPYDHESDEVGSGDRSRRSRRPRDRRRHRNHDRKPSRSRSEKSGGRSRHEELSSDDSAGYTGSRRNPPSGTHRSERNRRRSVTDDGSRSARRSTDDEHLSRKGRDKKRGKSHDRNSSRERLYEEDESPASDFYMDEDKQRQRTRVRY